MAELGLTFNARLYDIEQALERGNLRPLAAYLRSDTIDHDVLKWLADRIDPAITGGHKLVIKKPDHRSRGGKSFDVSLAIAEAMDQLMNNPADQRTEEAKAQELATAFKCSSSKVRKDYRDWEKAKGFYPIDE